MDGSWSVGRFGTRNGRLAVESDPFVFAICKDIQIVQPNDPAFEYRILAEGDSWFSIGAIPSSNLLFELALPAYSIVVNLAYPGDTIENVSSLAGNPDLRRMLNDERWAYDWHAILLSAGGNDVIDKAPTFIRAAVQHPEKPESRVDAATLEQLVIDVKNGYREIVRLRDEPGSMNSGKPIVAHTYDYPTPRNSPAKFLIAGIGGPWLHRVLDKVGAPAEVRFGIARHVIDALAEGLLSLTRGSQRLPNFHVVDTRGTLIPANAGDLGNSNDWLNEIHPNHQGYRKLARRISRKLGSVLR
jgi:lysophospholipase L1-like esterase